MAVDLPAVGYETARSQFEQQKSQARSIHWELTSEFDSMLSQLLANDASISSAFTRRFREDPTTAGVPDDTDLSRVEEVWKRVFPGRQLDWEGWKPNVVSTISGSHAAYSGNQMSDGEKSALFLAGRVFTAAPNAVVVVDEPETHFHPLLATRLWDQLEDARSDLRFVYVTHDVTFAMSRRNARFVLASPTQGLRLVDLGAGLPDEVSTVLLGSASLSFYASRIVFCEGEPSSYDAKLYSAWFNGVDTVVRSVSTSQHVLRCVDALKQAKLALSLEAVGIIDRDHYSAQYLESFNSGVHVLPVHEVESLFCLPDVIAAVAAHLDKPFDPESFKAKIVERTDSKQVHQLAIQRWKARIEPQLQALIADTSKRNKTTDELAEDLPEIFDMNTWKFSPKAVLLEESDRLTSALAGESLLEILALLPGKPLLPVAAREFGMNPEAYTDLIIGSLRKGSSNKNLADAVEKALSRHLPPRAVAISGMDIPLVSE
ncbi:DUF4435 domain-containing protein [Nocardia thraciensis]